MAYTETFINITNYVNEKMEITVLDFNAADWGDNQPFKNLHGKVLQKGESVSTSLDLNMRVPSNLYRLRFIFPNASVTASIYLDQRLALESKELTGSLGERTNLGDALSLVLAGMCSTPNTEPSRSVFFGKEPGPGAVELRSNRSLKLFFSFHDRRLYISIAKK